MPFPAPSFEEFQGKDLNIGLDPAQTLKQIDEQNNNDKLRQAYHYPWDAAFAFGSSIFSSLPKIALNAFLIAAPAATRPMMINFHNLARSPVLSATAAPPPTISAVKPYSATLSPLAKSL